MADRISTDAPLTLTDHRLIWATVAVVARVIEPTAAREAMLRDELARACRLSDSRNSHVRRLHAAAQAVADAAPGPAALCALVEAGDELARFAEWRLGCALADSRTEDAA